MKARYTPATDAKLTQWNAEKLPLPEQAARLGVTTSTINNWRRRLGFTPGYAPVPPELHAKILEWAEDGWPIKEVAETAKLPINQVRTQYPQLRMDPATQGSLGGAVRMAVRRNPSVMKGL